ncbi:kinase-like domain-containing protein [Rhodofomes roseus]|uniref:Kinase-like domain-containing protein n=1 Tax=Rhodofomes roseus TaxID=34475 RepID=A0ABQ8KG10_9APHY|nr:kinase-like domain-containing protein [Rhodofomes roseus]KAH9836714.1 kinase-like domain-containing protein [Rhodofomes roseus]
MQSQSRERVSASEFPLTPSICHGGHDGCVTDFLEAIRAEGESINGSNPPYILCSPSVTKVDITGGQLTSGSTVSFAVEPACVFKAAMDNDIDEGMVIKKCPSLAGLADNRSTCESGSTMSLTEDYANHAGSRRINASDFEVIRQVERRQTASWKGELVIGRKNDTARLYAIKVFRKTSLGADQGGYTYARTEQAALRSVTERAIPFAMHLCWSFQDEKALYLIMNYVASDLRTFVECHGVLALSDAAIYASQLVHGLMALHAIGIVHCNINPSSLFIENGYLVISDFGHAQIGMGDLAQHVRRANHGPCKGEVEQYQAPELLLEWSPHAVSDWWGFGLVFYYMLTAKHPFLDLHEMVASHPAIVINKILHGKLPKWLVEGDDGALEDLLRKCLERNPAHRLSGEGVKAHPFFSDMNWELSPTNTPLGLCFSVILRCGLTHLSRFGMSSWGDWLREPCVLCKHQVHVGRC